MKKIGIILLCIVIALTAPVRVEATWNDGWQYSEDKIAELWYINEGFISSIMDVDCAYELTDFEKYAYYVESVPEYNGEYIPYSMIYTDKTRMAYMTSIQVKKGQKISVTIPKGYYVRCAEFDESFIMLDAGQWHASGDVWQLQDETEWIIVIFRHVGVDSAAGEGVDLEMDETAMEAISPKYVLLRPFTYSFDMDGGTYMGEGAYTMERWGTESLDLPMPHRDGYKFMGWQLIYGGRHIYNGSLPDEYNEILYRDCSFKALWDPIPVEYISLDKPYIIMEQNSGETVSLTPQFVPSDALDKSLSWSSDDPDIAMVDENGVVTAKNSGLTVIRAIGESGIMDKCAIYVMGFDISVPAYCTLNETYSININVYNNGSRGMDGRKSVILDMDDAIELVRVGDPTTRYNVLAEASADYNSGYMNLEDRGYLVQTQESVTVYYRLKPAQNMERAGDYEGSVVFNVSVV